MACQAWLTSVGEPSRSPDRSCLLWSDTDLSSEHQQRWHHREWWVPTYCLPHQQSRRTFQSPGALANGSEGRRQWSHGLVFHATSRTPLCCSHWASEFLQLARHNPAPRWNCLHNPLQSLGSIPYWPCGDCVRISTPPASAHRGLWCGICCSAGHYWQAFPPSACLPHRQRRRVLHSPHHREEWSPRWGHRLVPSPPTEEAMAPLKGEPWWLFQALARQSGAWFD